MGSREATIYEPKNLFAQLDEFFEKLNSTENPKPVQEKDERLEMVVMGDMVDVFDGTPVVQHSDASYLLSFPHT